MEAILHPEVEEQLIRANNPSICDLEPWGPMASNQLLPAKWSEPGRGPSPDQRGIDYDRTRGAAPRARCNTPLPKPLGEESVPTTHHLRDGLLANPSAWHHC